MNGRDTTAVGPWSDFVLFGANYSVANKTISLCAELLSTEYEHSASVEKELRICGADKANLSLENGQLKTRVAIAEEGLARCGTEKQELQDKVDRRTPWATAMKIEVGLIIVGAIVVVAGLITNP